LVRVGELMTFTDNPVISGRIWHSPVNVYWHYQRLQEHISQDVLDNTNKYQKVREALVGSVIALSLYQLNKRPSYIQLHEPDPPDVLVLQPSFKVKGQMDISLLEVTSYTGQPKDTLLEQLKRTKCPPNLHIYSENYVVVVNAGIGLEVQFESIREYLNENRTPFPIWTLKQISNYPDTIAELVIVNPDTKRLEINIGEAVYHYQKERFPDVIKIKRAGNVKKVRQEPGGKYHKAPWDIK
jgi:hypothetical protein